MVVKKKAQKNENIISENDRLKLQLLNANADRAEMAVENAQVRMKNAQMGILIAQRDLDVLKGELKVFGDTIASKYNFSLTTDSVDWTTGEIKRHPEEDEVDDA